MMSLLHRCSGTSRTERRTFRPRAWGFALELLALLSATSISCAAPFTPANDNVVVDRVPAGSMQRQLQPLRRELASNPHDVNATLKLARAYLDIGRSSSDPRFISYAEATLAPRIQRPDASVDVLILGAIALQSSHRFDDALALLERSLQADSRNAQALLTKATILQVRGEFGAARNTCARMIRSADLLVAITCAASVNAMNGGLETSYAALDRAFKDGSSLSYEVRSWVLGQLGEMAVRLGHNDDAERHFKAALTANPLDLQVKAEYADLLLGQQRAAEVVALLKDHEEQDSLLLRLALAGHSRKATHNNRWSTLYAARYETARRDGDPTHLREQARYELEILGDAVSALQLAQQNWQVQREPADIRILARAASAARDAKALRSVAAWMDENHYEDLRLTSDVPQLRSPS